MSWLTLPNVALAVSILVAIEVVVLSWLRR
jgi:hypothetical protein